MPRLLRLKEVMEMTGKSRSSIYADQSFPRQLKIGARSVAWHVEEIEQWIAARVADRSAANGMSG